jgi:hypothetical protein
MFRILENACGMRSGRINKVLVLSLIVLVFAGCKKSHPYHPGNNGEDSVTWHPDDLPPADNTVPAIKIDWDASARKISHEVGYAEYGRIERIKGDTLLLTYHCGPWTNGSDVFYGDDIAIRRSTDNGDTWSAAEIIKGSQPDYYGFCNPQILVLKNGWLMLAYAGRGKPDDNTHDNVQVKISKDEGQTWGDPVIAAQGRSWEPGLIQLPDGKIELFYSSEAAWWPGSDVQQEILMIHSNNNGSTWSTPQQVSYSSGNRDGMPVPLILKDNKGLIFSIESVGNAQSPWIVWSSIDADWNYKTYGTTQNGRRWIATKENIWGGAPYIIQLPSGETILSVQDADGRAIGSDWKKNTMLVLTGNSIAKNFTNTSYPWPNLPVTEGAYFNSLFLKNDSTLVAVTTRSFTDGHSEIWWKEGHIHQ